MRAIWWIAFFLLLYSPQAFAIFKVTEDGCKVDVEAPDPARYRIFTWTGECRDGYAEGPGVLTLAVNSSDGRSWQSVNKGAMKNGGQVGVWISLEAVLPINPQGVLRVRTFTENGAISIESKSSYSPSARREAESELARHFKSPDAILGLQRRELTSSLDAWQGKTFRAEQLASASQILTQAGVPEAAAKTSTMDRAASRTEAGKVIASCEAKVLGCFRERKCGRGEEKSGVCMVNECSFPLYAGNANDGGFLERGATIYTDGSTRGIFTHPLLSILDCKTADSARLVVDGGSVEQATVGLRLLRELGNGCISVNIDSSEREDNSAGYFVRTKVEVTNTCSTLQHFQVKIGQEGFGRPSNQIWSGTGTLPPRWPENIRQPNVGFVPIVQIAASESLGGNNTAITEIAQLVEKGKMPAGLVYVKASCDQYSAKGEPQAVFRDVELQQGWICVPIVRQ